MSEFATTSEMTAGVASDFGTIVFASSRSNPDEPYSAVVASKCGGSPLPLFCLGLGVALSSAWGVVLTWLTLSAVVSIGMRFGSWVS
jgi:hypothetical protein